MTRRGLFRSLAQGLTLLAIAPLASKLAPRVPVLYGDGAHDDTLALRAWGAGLPVNNRYGNPVGPILDNGIFYLRETLTITRQDQCTIIGCYFHLAPGGDRGMRLID